jgi:hypothetical protein
VGHQKQQGEITMFRKKDDARDLVNGLVTEHFLADSFVEQVALTDMIMNELNQREHSKWTPDFMRMTIEKEVQVWLTMKERDKSKWIWGTGLK